MENKIKPTEDEIKNGWTEESLNLYFRNRDKAQFATVFNKKPKRPFVQNSKYSPFKYR